MDASLCCSQSCAPVAKTYYSKNMSRKSFAISLNLRLRIVLQLSLLGVASTCTLWLQLTLPPP